MPTQPDFSASSSHGLLVICFLMVVFVLFSAREPKLSLFSSTLRCLDTARSGKIDPLLPADGALTPFPPFVVSLYLPLFSEWRGTLLTYLLQKVPPHLGVFPPRQSTSPRAPEGSSLSPCYINTGPVSFLCPHSAFSPQGCWNAPTVRSRAFLFSLPSPENPTPFFFLQVPPFTPFSAGRLGWVNFFD